MSSKIYPVCRSCYMYPLAVEFLRATRGIVNKGGSRPWGRGAAIPAPPVSVLHPAAVLVAPVGVNREPCPVPIYLLW